MTFFLCLRHPTRPRAQWKASLQEHLDWMKQRHADGSVLMSGPSRDLGVSIYIIRAHSLAEAEAIAQADPFTAAGDGRPEVIDWNVHQIAGIGSFVAGADH
jgi:uncharacterized protein YciI